MRRGSGFKQSGTRAEVHQQTQRSLVAGRFAALIDDLRAVVRLAATRHAKPIAAIIDNRTLRSTPDSGERAGSDGRKARRFDVP